MTAALFRDREHAGLEIAKKLSDEIKKYPLTSYKADDLVVAAIPRGGVVLGDVIAEKLNCKLDVIISRKIRSDFNEEFALGAVMPDGEYFVNEGYVDMFHLSKEYLNKEVEFQRKEINRRLIKFRNKVSYEDEFNDKIVILVDDGIATGATIIASARWIKNNFRCKFLIVAVPVAPANDRTITILEKIADRVLILRPEIMFSAVGQFYERFGQVSDEEVQTIMKKYSFP